MNDGDFLAAFESSRLPEDCFHHRDHVRGAWLLLREETPAGALDYYMPETLASDLARRVFVLPDR